MNQTLELLAKNYPHKLYYLATRRRAKRNYLFLRRVRSTRSYVEFTYYPPKGDLISFRLTLQEIEAFRAELVRGYESKARLSQDYLTSLRKYHKAWRKQIEETLPNKTEMRWDFYKTQPYKNYLKFAKAVHNRTNKLNKFETLIFNLNLEK